MSSDFSTDFKELVRERTDIVELIGESIALVARRGGREHIGLCPFHDDHNPSFTVDRERQSYKCWSCGEGGDCYSFVMKIDGLAFPEALENLAVRANLDPPKCSRRSSNNGGQDKKQLYEILSWAEQEFHTCLMTSSQAAQARQYIESQRGFNRESLEKFRVGYHPDSWEWLLSRARGRYSSQQLHQARLVRERRDGSGYYDDFVNRVLFPIRDDQGRAVAFGGRILPGGRDSDAPKYLNSPESILFEKSKRLYGLDAAKESIRKSETAVIVEGYTDCIMAHQHGVRNVVGTLGTALTEAHVTALKRFARKVVLVFDGDQAGQAAAERSLVQFLAQDIDLRILTLDEGIDPADSLAKSGGAGFRRLIEAAVEAWEYKLQTTFSRIGLDTIDARQQVLDEMIQLLAQVSRLSGTVRENIILDRLAHRVGMSEQAVRQRLTEARKRHAERGSVRRFDRTTADQPGGAEESRKVDLASGQLSKDDQLELELLEIIFADPQSMERISRDIDVNELRNPQLKQLLSLCYSLWERGVAPSYERVTTELEDPDLKRSALTVAELSEKKQVAQLLTQNDQSGDGTGDVLQETIDNMKWRRTVKSHEISKGHMSQLSGSSQEFDENAKALLRRVSEFHAKRANKKTTT